MTSATRYVSSLSVVSVLILLAGCSPFGGARSQGGAPPVTLANCSRGITQKQIDSFIAQNSNSNLGTLIGAEPFRCATNHLTEFASLSAVPAMKLGHTTSLNQDVGETIRADVEVIQATLSDDEIQTIARTIGSEQPAAVTVGIPTFDSALLGDLPEVTQQLVTNENGTVLRFYVPKALSEVFSQRLNDFATGATAISFFAWPDYGNGVVWSAQVKADQLIPLQTSALKSVSANQYLTDLWARIGNTSGAAGDKYLPYLWMDRARVWWPNLKMQPADGQRDWQPAWSAANDLWSQPGSRTENVGAASSLKALRFLLTVDPQNSAKPYADKLKKLEPFLGTDDQALYEALMDLTVKGHYSEDQSNSLFDLASHLTPVSDNPAQAWNEALKIATKAKFDKKTLDGVAVGVDWVHATQGTSGIAEVESWVFDRGVTADRLVQMKAFYEFLTKESFAGNPWEKTVDITVNKTFSRAEMEAYQAIVEAVHASPTPGVAYDKAEDYLVAHKISADRVKAIASTIKWLSATSHSGEAIAKAEDYLLTKKMNPADVLRIQRLWIWMQHTSRNLEALEKAEEWVIGLKLTAEQTNAIILSYEWLVYTPGGANAFSQSEDYVVNKKLTIDQIDQMRALEGWLHDSSVGAGATAKAEEYVIAKKLSRMQTDLIEVSYLWLRDTPAKANALVKAEDYVLNKQLNPGKFQKLRDAYTKYSTGGDKDALVKAEADTLGG
jgi:hypothetical protein